MVRRVQTFPMTDFRGGINYNADAFQLRDDEVAEANNVDFDPNGGVARRKNVAGINQTALTNIPKNIWTFFSADGTYKHLMVQDGNDAAYSTGANFTAINPDALTLTGTMFAATANDKCYVQRNGEQVVWTWNGSASAVLTDSHGAYNDNFAAPVGGKMPKARYIVRHRNYLFHAVINEAGTLKRSRLRFSHPFSDLTGTKGAEDYRTNDWIEIEPGDGDEITGMVSWKDRLLIFKNTSVWALYGYDHDSFELVNISHHVGATGQKAITIGDEGVYFFSWPEGLQVYDGRQVRDLFYPLIPLTKGNGSPVDAEQIDSAHITQAAIGYVNHRCWVAVTTGFDGSTVNDRVYVYDPNLSKAGGWTKYKIPIGAIATYQPPGGNVLWYATNPNTKHVLEIDQGLGSTQDLYTFSGTWVNTPIDSYVYTTWVDLNNTALDKRWKHPLFTVDGNNAATLMVEVYKDYSWFAPARSFSLVVPEPQPGMLWDVDDWDVGFWAGSYASSQEILKGGSLGRGKAVALRIDGPTSGDTPWSVNNITFKYVSRRIRS